MECCFDVARMPSCCPHPADARPKKQSQFASIRYIGKAPIGFCLPDLNRDDVHRTEKAADLAATLYVALSLFTLKHVAVSPSAAGCLVTKSRAGAEFEMLYSAKDDCAMDCNDAIMVSVAWSDHISVNNTRIARSICQSACPSCVA
jgi:hypothetical protein